MTESMQNPDDGQPDLKTEKSSEDMAFQVSPSTPNKRKRDEMESSRSDARDDRDVRKGQAAIKPEFLIPHTEEVTTRQDEDAANDDAAEAYHHKDRQPGSHNNKRREKNQGQNKNRKFGSSRDEVGLCSTRTFAPELSPEDCQFGEKCKFEHDLRKYLLQYKREDLRTFEGKCPVWALRGKCNVGWKCRFVGSHSKEITREDETKELVLTEIPELISKYQSSPESTDADVANVISIKDRIQLTKKKFQTPKSQEFLDLLDREVNESSDKNSSRNGNGRNGAASNNGEKGKDEMEVEKKADERAEYKETPLLPSEKRRLYFGPETPVLAPLTTQGNLPFRRLCSSMGATFTYSEMAMSLPLLQGHKPEWALIKAHESEVSAPTFTRKGANVVYDYEQSKDVRFGAQIAANKPWVCLKATEALTTLLPRGLRLVDLNVGCPIDLVYREGAGSALMDSPAKLEKMLRGMNAVSGDVPITCKIRMGTKDKVPTAQKLVDRLVLGLRDGSTAPSGVAAITLHGRSRQQRYTRKADWEYIAETAALIKNLNAKADSLTDTVREADGRDLPGGSPSNSGRSKVYFIGNGDVYSHIHYNQHIDHAGVDSVMVARGALIKPWIFEEIQSGQYLDKSASERLAYIETFCKYGLEAWGSDEIGVGQTRRFLLEWLSFACRYVPLGLLEHLPPSIQDRPPKYRGRDDLETLMASDNYMDWIKLSEMFLGPAHKDFRFEPKHKSNSYEIQAEG